MSYNPLFPIRCYLDSEAHETDKQMRFVDMAIEVDSHMHHWNEKTSEGNWVVDKDRMFNLIYSLCLMLACKMYKLKDAQQYDDFAFFLAYDVFDKIERPRHAEFPIKSVLNYIKSIIGFRKMQFLTKENQHILDPLYTRGWDGEAYKLKLREQWEAKEKTKKIDNIKSFFEEFHTVIKKNIPAQFKTNKIIYKYIYLSVCISLIESLKVGIGKKASILDLSVIILLGLTEDYRNIVTMVFNKSLIELGNEIRDIIDDYKISDDEYYILMGSAFENYGTEDQR